MTPDYNQALAFVQAKHQNQFHACQLPVWHHLARVSARLAYVLELHQEGDPELRELIAVAALGHDLFEDTHATPEEVIEVFGIEGYHLIEGMTNEHGDEWVGPYVEKIAQASEEVRLIKLADLGDNVTSVAYNMITLGTDWVEDFFVPIVAPIIDVILETEFTRYPNSARDFISYLRLSYALLEREFELFSALED